MMSNYTKEDIVFTTGKLDLGSGEVPVGFVTIWGDRRFSIVVRGVMDLSPYGGKFSDDARAHLGEWALGKANGGAL